MRASRWPLCLGSLLVFAALAIAVRAFAATPASRLVYLRSPDALACGDETVLRGAVARRFGYDPFYPWRWGVCVEM